MKKLSFAIFSLIFGIKAFANQEPSLYTCQGANGVSVNFSASSLTGDPHFNLKIGQKQYNVMKNEHIRQDDTIIGKIVSITDSKMAMVDGPFVHYALVLPQVNLGEDNKVTVKTHLIESVQSSGFFPHHLSLQMQSNKMIPVTCEAQFVVF